MNCRLARTGNLNSRKQLVNNVATPYVGRASLLMRLNDCVKPLIALVGEPGIGKSRALAEARGGAAARDNRFFTVTCLHANQAIPFEPASALARSLRRRGRITDQQYQTYQQARGHDRAWYFCESIELAASDQPLTLQIDDIHWADSESVEAILSAVDRLQDLPIRWQVALRTDQGPLNASLERLAAQGLAQIVRVEGLTRDETLELARTFVSPEARASLDHIRLWTLSAGNPLYIEYCARAEASGHPVGLGSLRQLFENRVVSISAPAADLCSWLAVSGRPVPIPTLAALAGLSVTGVSLLVEELYNSGLVVLSADGPSFRHALIRDACYGLLDDADRRKRNKDLVTYADNDWHRVIHLDGSGMLVEAGVTYNRIGWRHIDAAEPERALNAFKCARERIPVAETSAAEACAGVSVALMWLGRTADSMQTWHDFRTARSSQVDALSVTANVRLAEAAWENGEDVETALPMLRNALESAPGLAPHMLPQISLLLGAIHERRNELSKAEEHLEIGLAAAASVADSRVALRLRSWLAVVKARRGDVADGVALLEAVVERAEELRYPNEVAQACVKLCYLSDMAGEYERYAAWCRRGLRDNGPASTYLQSLLMTNLASVETDAGNLRTALAHSVSAERLTTSICGNLVGRALCQQAMLLATMGSFGPARECLARIPLHRLTESWRRAVDYSSGVVDELRGEITLAAQRYKSALSTNGERVTEVFELRSLAGLVRVACVARDLERARSALALLRASCNEGWRISESLLAEAEGDLALAQGDLESGCMHLDRAKSTARHRVRQLVLAARVAEAQMDRHSLSSCIANLDDIEAFGFSDAMRKRARALGMRPGKRRRRKCVLSDRELDVARLIAAGKTNREIANVLSVTRRTVEFHVASIFRKLDLTSRVELAAMLARGAISGAELNNV